MNVFQSTESDTYSTTQTSQSENESDFNLSFVSSSYLQTKVWFGSVSTQSHNTDVNSEMNGYVARVDESSQLRDLRLSLLVKNVSEEQKGRGRRRLKCLLSISV